MNGLFTTNSSQVASADVLGRQILVLKNRANPVICCRASYRWSVACSVRVRRQLQNSRCYRLAGWTRGLRKHCIRDGLYGVLAPTMEAWEQDESLSQANYLADLKIHRVLGKLDSVDYFEHQNHRSLAAYWAPDSSICVVENDARYGAESISVLFELFSNGDRRSHPKVFG